MRQRYFKPKNSSQKNPLTFFQHGYQVSPNRELVAMGVANTFGAFFRAYPTFGSLTRTAMADYYGAKSQVYTLIASCIVLATIFFLGPVRFYIFFNCCFPLLTVWILDLLLLAPCDNVRNYYCGRHFTVWVSRHYFSLENTRKYSTVEFPESFSYVVFRSVFPPSGSLPMNHTIQRHGQI